MAKKPLKASGVLTDVGGFLYGDAAKERLASILGVPVKVIHDTLRGHGGLPPQKLLDLVEARAAECTMLRDLLRQRLTHQLKKERSKRG